jgi:hypothetical protein
MRRALLAAVVTAVVAATVVLIWRWWTAPPRAAVAVLAQALALAPEDADGSLALAEPARSARWLASHPQALALLEIAAPSADRALPRLRGFLTAIAREARGPLTLWWRGGELAAGATVGTGAARALQRLAALQGFPLRAEPSASGDVVVRAATAPALLAGPGPPPAHLDSDGALAALARLGPRIWRASAGRSALELLGGNPPALPQITAADMLATGDLAALAAPVTAASWIPHAPARLLFDGTDWAVELPDTAFPREVARLLAVGGDLPGGSPGGARHWQGLLGDLWVRPGPGIAAASRPDLLERLPSAPITGESGAVRGPALGRLCLRIAGAFQVIPGGARGAAGLRRAAPLLDAVRLARWRLLPQGGHVLLEW